MTTLLALVGKFGASAAFGVIYLYTAEVFPTVMRNSGLGLCSICARFGAILSPYIGDLVRSKVLIPNTNAFEYFMVKLSRHIRTISALVSRQSRE